MSEKYDKLVRDLIPEIIREDGRNPLTFIANDDEYEKRLFEKLGEEVAEFRADPSKEEAADVVEVLRAICDLRGWTMAEIEEVRKIKAKERGAFVEKIILTEIE